jgi:acyl homoserine lactone synthase
VLQLITPDCYGEFVDELTAMHQLRYRVFKERLDWEVEVAGDLETDSFDALQPSYLLLRGAGNEIAGCVRLLPTTGPNMLRDAFPALLGGEPSPESPDIWESSRFALDIDHQRGGGARALAASTYELFTGMVEFGLARNLNWIVTVTDARMERILRRAGWPLERIGRALPIGNTTAVAGYLEISRAALARLRQAGGFKGPVLWAPVVQAA